MIGKLCFALLMFPVLAFAEQDTIVKSFDVQPGGTLAVNIDRGNIKILTSNTGKVEVEVTRELKRGSFEEAQKAFESHKIEFSQEGDVVRIEAENAGLNTFRHLVNRLEVEYTVRIPGKFNVELETGGGNVAVEDLDGKVKARTTGGSLDLGAIGGEIHARTSGGNVKVRGCKASLDVNTTGGSISIGNVDGNLDAKTAGGNITVQQVKGTLQANTTGGSIKIAAAGGPVNAKTSGGHVSAELMEGASGECTLKTTGGTVTLSLPENIAADLHATTVGGRVKSDFEGEFNKQRTKLHTKLNGGGPEMRLATSGGNVEIRRK